ncbi:MAG: hypothetical protein IKK59_05750 [Lachnospiraceae bacterium]|nr:hypothetical protein [Lachnospiraceae bacterium]
MPVSIRGYTVKNKDCTFTIVLNSRHTREQNLLSYSHELAHIDNGDYDNNCDVSILEMAAHKTY